MGTWYRVFQRNIPCCNHKASIRIAAFARFLQIERFAGIHYQTLDEHIKAGEALIIYGPRRSGKTTLVKSYLKKCSNRANYYLGDDLALQETLGSRYLEKIRQFAQGQDLIVIDEAHKIPNIGIALKMIVDTMPNTKVVATGSSSFELAGQVGEPLTGRKQTLVLYPLSLLELKNTASQHDLMSKIPQTLVFGLYPEVYTADSVTTKVRKLKEITNSYLLKDILELEKVKGSKVLLDLLRLVAYQIGSEVSTTELGRQLSLDYKTVARYLDMFEKSFILISLRGYSRNLRKKVTKMSKYYFDDNGIRNTLISNFNDIAIRDDVGKLWENFMVTERIKKQEYKGIHANNYFWRTWDQKEIDWVEECGGRLMGYEFKWRKDKKKIKVPQDWKLTYPNASYEVITKEGFWNFAT